MGITHAHLMKLSIAHIKKRIPLLHLLINCITARATPQILSIKGGYTFLLIGLCNSLINYCLAKSEGCWFDIFSFLTAPPEQIYLEVKPFFSKNL